VGHAAVRAPSSDRATLSAAASGGPFVGPPRSHHPDEGHAIGARLYDNTGNPANTYYAAQGGAEAIDDLHMAWEGSPDSLVFEYFDPAAGGAFSATVNLYGNPGGLDLGTTPFAGPFVVTGLPRGRGTAAIALPPGLAPLVDLWVGVQFTSATAGLIIHSAPAVGSSHDLYLENGSFFWFDGNPRANFGLRVVGTPHAVSVGGGGAPAGVSLAPARPNPFRDRATLHYAIERRGPVRIDVLDPSGRRVRALVDGERESGRYLVRWSGTDDAGRVVEAGVYFVRLAAASGVATRRVVFLR
jgi:hypothetical protein